MFNILYKNIETNDNIKKLEIKLIKDKLTATLTGREEYKKEVKKINYAIIDNLQSYHSYALVERYGKLIQVKTSRTTKSSSTCSFIDLNRMGVAVKEDFGLLLNMYDFNIIFQIDTGIISDKQKDLIITLVSVNKENLEIFSDIDYNFKLKHDGDRYPREFLDRKSVV